MSLVSVKQKLLLPAAVETRGDGNGLTIPGFQEFQLAQVDGLADRVVDKGLRIGLLHGRHNLGKRNCHGGGELRMQRLRAPVGQVHLAVNDVGVSAGGGTVKRPLKFAEGDGQPSESHIALGPRVAQALGFGRKVSRHGRQQMRLVEVETLA